MSPCVPAWRVCVSVPHMSMCVESLCVCVCGCARVDVPGEFRASRVCRVCVYSMCMSDFRCVSIQ